MDAVHVAHMGRIHSIVVAT